MLPFRLASVLLAAGVLQAAFAATVQAQSAAASPLGALLAQVPGAQLSDGRGPLDRAGAKGEGPLAPAGLIVNAPMVVVGTKTLPAQDAGELVSWMRAKGRAVRVGHAGAWSASLECALQLRDVLETAVTLVPAADAAEAMAKLKSGAVDVMCEAVPAIIADIRAGDVLAFVLASDERLPALWDVATADQAGLPLFSATAWLGLYAPAPDVAAPVIAKALTDDLVQTLADRGWMPFAPIHQTGEAHTQQLIGEAERRKGRLTDAGLPVAP